MSLAASGWSKGTGTILTSTDFSSAPVRPTAFSRKRLAVHGDPRVRHRDDADGAPALGELGERREGRHQRVVLTAGEHPVQGVGAQRGTDFGEPRGDVEVGG